MSTDTRKVAESIARRGVPYSWLNNEDEYRTALNWFANEIDKALRDERERLIDRAVQSCLLWIAVLTSDERKRFIERLQAAIRRNEGSKTSGK